MKYGLTGIYTLVGIVQDDGHGRLMVGGWGGPYDPSSRPYFDIRNPGTPSLFVVVGMGKRLAWGLSRDKGTPMNFKDGVAVVVVPEKIIEKVQIWELPPR